MCPSNSQVWRSVPSWGMSHLAPGWQVTLLRWPRSAPPCLPRAQRMEGDAPAGFSPGDKISRLPQTTLGTRTLYSSFIFKSDTGICIYWYLNWATESAEKAVVLPPVFFILRGQTTSHQMLRKCDLILSAHNIMKTGRRFFSQFYPTSPIHSEL